MVKSYLTQTNRSGELRVLTRAGLKRGASKKSGTSKRDPLLLTRLWVTPEEIRHLSGQIDLAVVLHDGKAFL